MTNSNVATSIADFGSNSQEKLRSYWNRPGGKFGTIVGLALLGLAGYALVPVLTTIVWNTINFAIALGVGGALAYMVSHRKLRMSLFYFYEILMKRLVGVVIEMDPFIIAESNIKDMEDQRNYLSEQIIVVNKECHRISNKITEKEAEIERGYLRIQAAGKNDDKKSLATISRSTERAKEYIKNLAPLREKLKQISEYLTAVYENSEYVIEDAKNHLANQKDLYYTVTAGSNAMKSAMGIFKGDPEKKLLVEQSMDYLRDDIAAKLGAMQQAMDITSTAMRSIDLDNATYEIAGLETLKQLAATKQETLDTGEFVPGVLKADKYQNLISAAR
jgi:hypothetical protein